MYYVSYYEYRRRVLVEDRFMKREFQKKLLAC